MGCGIHGWVEIRPFSSRPHYWNQALNIGAIVRRNYDMYALLFGVRNHAHFSPIAEERGLPEDVSDPVKKNYESWGLDAYSPSYITWQEIERINWQGQASEEVIACYLPGENKPSMSFTWSPDLSEEDYELLSAGKDLVKKGLRYRKERARFQDALTNDWKFLFQLMGSLEEYYKQGEPIIVDAKARPSQSTTADHSRSRLVVWFDS